LLFFTARTNEEINGVIANMGKAEIINKPAYTDRVAAALEKLCTAAKAQG